MSNIDIYLPPENDIFIFSRSCTVGVAKEAGALVLELTVPVGEKEIVLTEEVFESVTTLLNGEKDARAEYGDQHDLYNHAAEISDEDVDEMEETVCVDTIARKANSSCSRTGLVVFVTILFSGVFVAPLYDYHNLFLI